MNHVLDLNSFYFHFKALRLKKEIVDRDWNKKKGIGRKNIDDM